MPAPRLIFVDPRESARDHIDDTLADFPVRLVTVADGLEAFHQAMSLAPDLVILGSGLPHHQIQILLERTQGIHSLRHIAILVIAPEFSRENVLHFLKLGARDYLLEPHTTEALIQRIARHIPLGPSSPQPIAPRGSIGERLRQRRSKKLQSTSPPPPPRTARSTADIEIVEYKFTNDSGLLVRNESRQLPLSEKIDD
jgi:DNA-binding response OmpR family regulator